MWYETGGSIRRSAALHRAISIFLEERDALRERLKTTEKELDACSLNADAERNELLCRKAALEQELAARERIAGELRDRVYAEWHRSRTPTTAEERGLTALGVALWGLAAITVLQMLAEGCGISLPP